MEVGCNASDSQKRSWTFIPLVLAVIGVVHFTISLVAWGLFYFASYRLNWSRVLTVGYGARHLSPAIALFGLFMWATITASRGRRSALPALALAVLLTLGTFGLDTRGEPQFQRVWIDDPMTCSNRQSHYCTWWWWRPTRH